MTQYIDKSVEMYNEIIEQSEDGPNSVGWGSKHSQYIRFNQLKRAFDLGGIEDILDVGCGMGALYEYIRENDLDIVRYTGIDINRRYVDYCNKRHESDKNCQFIQMNLLEDSLPFEEVDLVFASGLFGTPFDGRDDFVKKMLRKFYDISRYGFIFNMENSLGIKTLTNKENCDPLYWLSYVIKSINCQVQFYSDYHDNDFTIAVRKR